MKRILAVVDMQRDFVDGTLGTAEASAIVENAAERIRSFSGEIVYTMDTHSADYPETQEGKRLPAAHCMKGTEGWELSDAIRLALENRGACGAEHKVDKQGFGSLLLPQRMEKLLGGAPEEIVLLGLCTDICVISNAMILKAAFPEARISVDASCCAGVTPQSHRNALSAMEMCQIDIENLPES